VSDEDHENDLGDVRYRMMQIGTVVDRLDPLGLGCVKVRIPGLCDGPSTGWAFPLGSPGGGGKQVGLKFVPQLNAEVAVFFKGGDPDRPYYMPANWGTGEMLTDAAAAPPEQAPDVHCIETTRYKITIDDRTSDLEPTAPSLTITDKISGDMIQFDDSTATGPGILIKATAGLVVQCDGVFAVTALRVVMNGRVMAEGSQSF
jgi:hypothetical protein